MDDHMRGWLWTRPGDKYCDALPMEHDADAGEPYVDSLRQLNKIVERILPEKSPLSLMSVRPKLDIPMSLKRSYVDHRDRELPRRKLSSVSSTVTEIPIDSPVKPPPLTAMPSVCLEDSLRLKALRPSDSLNDSAYETFCGDASNDAIDSMDKIARTDELSSGNDPADYCTSPSGRKSDDDSKPACYSKEKDAGVVSGSLITDAGGDLLIDCERMRRKSLESGLSSETERHQDEQSERSEVFLSKSGSPVRSADRLLSDKCHSNSYRNKVMGSSDLSSAGSLPELGRQVTDRKCWNSTNVSVHRSLSLRVAKPGSAPSSSGSLPQGSSVIDSDHLVGRRLGNLREGRSSGDGDGDVKSFNCPHCAYSASKKGQVRKHLSVHGIFLCAHCEFACDRADLLEEHRHIRHPGLCGRRLCKKCRVLFQSSELEEHERQCSGEKQRWACHTCGKEFKFLSVMKAHAQKWHLPLDDSVSAKSADTTSDTASSKPCSVSSGTPIMMVSPTQQDAVIGKEVKQFQCSECGKMFKTKWTLSNHVLSHAGADTPFCCDVESCSGVTFRSDKELNCHRMAIHRLGPTKYQCSHPGCTMQFAKYGHFKRHQLTHTASAESELSSTDASERRFICDWTQCGKAFSHPDNLRVHYRRHTDEKPHHCHHCEAAYRQKSGLKYHLEKVHGEKTVGRCGRKRKLALENDGRQILPSSAFMPCKTGELHSDVINRSNDVIDGISANVKHTALSKFKDMNFDVADLQTKHRLHSDADSTAKGRSLSLPESSSQDCDDNLENIDINDEWLLDENDGFISSHGKVSEAVVTRNGKEGDREQAGSTSDTEPLDEDLCEELRKLSDAINSEVLSPRGLDRMSPPFGSPVGTAYGAAKSDGVGATPDMSSSHPGLFHGVGNHHEQTGVFDNFPSTPLPRDSSVTSDFYTRHVEGTMAAVQASGMLPHGQSNSSASDHSEMVNGCLPNEYSCLDLQPPRFDGGASTSESAHLPVDGSEIVDPAAYHSAPFQDSVPPWSVPVNSSRWSSHSSDSPAFMPAHGTSSVSACSSAEAGFSNQVRREGGTYSNMMSTWSPAENSQHWPGPDAIIPGWSQRHLATGPPDVSRRYDWQAELAFSRSSTAFDSRVGFESGHPTSPKPCVPYRTDMREAFPMSDHFIDSLASKHGSIYPASGIGHTGPWSDLYGRSPQMTGIGTYQYNLPRNVYLSPERPDQAERFYLTSGYSGIQSHANYEHGIETEGHYGISSSTYRMHAPSWPMPGLSSAGQSLRSVSDAQQSSVLYNVVPRYY